MKNERTSKLSILQYETKLLKPQLNSESTLMTKKGY